MSGRLFDPPVSQAVPEEPLSGATAADIKAALRRRHPGDTHGSMPGQWTCIEEWLNIDLLALNAWSHADVIGYEVKISRSDLRRELLRPHKRADALKRTTEFYLAVPAGLLSADEIAYEEPEWEAEDFERVTCPGVKPFGREIGHRSNLHRQYGGKCSRPYWRRSTKNLVRLPQPMVIVTPDWIQPHQGESIEHFDARMVDLRLSRHDDYHVCPTCSGKGYVERSRVEREAPTCWVPRDMGLVVVTKAGCRVIKKSPMRRNPEPIATTRKHMNDLVRWVSHRPDPRHR